MDNMIKKTVDVFFRRFSLVHHHLESANILIQTIIPEIIRDTLPIKYENDNYKIELAFENVYVHKPGIIEHDGSVSPLYPNECRLRNLSYTSPLFVNIKKDFTNKLLNKTVSINESVLCGYIPIMVRSLYCRLYNASEQELVRRKECLVDKGGYFIVNGTERVLMGIDRMAANIVYVFPNKHDVDEIAAEIMSMEERCRRSPIQFSVKMGISNALGRKNLTGVIDDFFKKPFPIGILLKILGFSGSVKDQITNNHLFDSLTGINRREFELIIMSIDEESFHIESKEDAVEFFTSISSTIGSSDDRCQAFIDSILQKEFLPHIGIDAESYPKKINFVIYMIQRLLLSYFKLRDYDDHDHFKNKRTDVSGFLLSGIFKQTWDKMNKELLVMIKKKLDSGVKLNNVVLTQIINPITMTKDINYVLATGNWCIIKNVKAKTGVSQVLNRFNHNAYLSHTGRQINPMAKDSTLARPRQQHNSAWGATCTFETPEGPSIGLTKNKTLSSQYSIGFSDIIILEFLHKYANISNEQCKWTVLVNGKLIGWTEDEGPATFLRSLKTKGMIPPDTGIYKNDRTLEINVFTDSGRNCRPLFTVEDNKIKLTKQYIDDFANGVKTWDNLIKEGVVEIIDSGEQENLLICVDHKYLGTDGMKYTHCELSSALLIGVCASVIPFANHDPAVRIVCQTSMSKQALSLPGTNFYQRMDTLAHQLHYPQKPLCPTDNMKYIDFNELPAGINSVIFITTYGGFNQEDAMILNKGGVERGFGRSSYYKTYEDIEIKSSEREERFDVPTGENGIDKLQPDGVVGIGTYVREGDMLIGKVSTDVGLDGMPIKPRCVKMKYGEEGIVDQVLFTENSDGTRSVKVKIRQNRIPEVGDKFAAPHSQKGVVGAVVPQQNLPFTGDGLVPDIIFNPHSLPSRMTIGMLLEALGGKTASLTGDICDSTIFGTRNVDAMGDDLAALGYERRGWETVYNGNTGEEMEVLVFVGSCYYQRLKHMVRDKWHSRGVKGPITSLTRAPVEGRSREGGLRSGDSIRMPQSRLQLVASLRYGRQYLKIAGSTTTVKAA